MRLRAEPSRRLLGIATAAVAILAVSAPAARAQAPAGCPMALLPLSKAESTAVTFPSRVRSVVVLTDSGSVAVAGATGTRVSSVSSRACWTGARPTLRQEIRDGVLYVASRCPRQPALPFLGGLCSRSFSLVVPALVELTVTTGSGAARSQSVSGPQSLTSGGGAVAALGAGGERVRVRTAAGAAAVDTVAPAKEVHAASDRGDVDVSVPSGVYAVATRAAGGSVNVTGLEADPEAPHRITAISGAGNVRVRARTQGQDPTRPRRMR